MKKADSKPISTTNPSGSLEFDGENDYVNFGEIKTWTEKTSFTFSL